MASKLFDRIATLLKADAHGVIESLEERSLLLKQCLREAEIELNHKRARLEVVRDEIKRLGETLAAVDEEMRSFDDDVGLALGGGKEELARFAARRLLERRRSAEMLRVQLAERADEEKTLVERIATQETRFESLRTRVRAELARRTMISEPDAWSGEPAVADEEVELELLRRRQGPHPTREGGC